jgi:hypothetical protein
MRNGLNTISILSLLILLKVHVWRKKDSWNRLYKLLVINSKKYTINIPYRLTNFQSTVVKPYYIKEEILDVLK